MNLKKTLALLMAMAMLVAVFAGCGSKDEKRSFARRSRRALLGIKQFREICHPQYYTIPQRPKSSLELEVEL